ncbi:hypothetical protein B0T19DRAFT_445372 [Cercophora scortea]|uniref:Uncharacterized protein n=1 Tax=Cercophora scortea TaxID=314031 RepID=A0AAE0I6U5_9PEZI|nr:hypothetical protein B0T19DRAFT_445372 [Cercophora scortea]
MESTENSLPTATQDDTTSTFSHESVFGMFLTLSLCLLTQPYGSLLYRPPTKYTHSYTHSDGYDSFVRAGFFLWRLSPVACISEAIVICFLTYRALLAAWKVGALPEPLRVTSWPFYDPRHEQNAKWTAHCHRYAAAILLLRANNISQSSLDDIIHAGGGGTMQEQDSGPSQGDRDHLPRCRPWENVGLAHKDRWVDLVTTFSVVVVVVKLAAMTLPWTVRVPAALLVVGWFGVQLLLYMFHLKEFDDNSMPGVAYIAKGLVNDLGNRYLGFAISGAAGLCSLYLGYCATFRGEGYILDRDLVPIARAMGGAHVLILRLPVMVAYSFAMWLVIPASLFGAVFVLSAPLLLVFCSGRERAWPWQRRYSRLFRDTEFEGDDDGWWEIVPFGLVMAVYWTLLFMVYQWKDFPVARATWEYWANSCIMTLFAVVLWRWMMGPTRQWNGCLDTLGADSNSGVVVALVVLAVYVFGIMLSSYDPAGTNKPAWLDVLG